MKREQLAALADRLGLTTVTLPQLVGDLNAIGYELNRDMDCLSMARMMTGPNAGLSYPSKSTGIREADTKMSAFHFEARRDDNFRALQKMRREGTHVVIGRGYLLEI